jgi:hypothetical protein
VLITSGLAEKYHISAQSSSTSTTITVSHQRRAR